MYYIGDGFLMKKTDILNQIHFVKNPTFFNGNGEYHRTLVYGWIFKKYDGFKESS